MFKNIHAYCIKKLKLFKYFLIREKLKLRNNLVEFKKFTKDKKALSDSFFLTKLFGGISQKDQLDLIEQGDKTKETVRLCLHNSPDDLLQMMLIYHPVKKDIDTKKYISQSSIYILLEGEFIIELFDEEHKSVEIVKMDKKNTMMYRIPKNQFYKVSMISDTLLFLEIRNGPFVKEEQIILKESMKDE